MTSGREQHGWVGVMAKLMVGGNSQGEGFGLDGELSPRWRSTALEGVMAQAEVMPATRPSITCGVTKAVTHLLLRVENHERQPKDKRSEAHIRYRCELIEVVDD